MRKLFGLLLSSVVAIAMVAGAVAFASPSQTYTGPYFGDGNLPPGCIKNMDPTNPDNKCFHMRVGLNALDSPKVDVLILAPVSPAVERDMRIMRQAIEMWEGGIEYLSGEMGMDWMKQVDFHITVAALGGEFTTYPVVDPEIVVIASNPVGGVGIGVDPVNLASQLQIMDSDGVPCHNVQNPFDHEMWESLPGFDSHHDAREGIYVEDCGGAGGNVCFAVNGAIDPVPGTTDVFGIFDLITHEVGHCLTVGHVGDGAEGSWGPVPTNDIMSYSEDPPGRSKCVSTLDVEGFALRMSRYLDRNGDGVVNGGDALDANDKPGDGSNSFQVQNPNDHLYATESGSPLDCPQPDVGLLPGEPVDWTPTSVATNAPKLELRKLKKKVKARHKKVKVAGSVSYVPKGAQPTESTASFVDREGDSKNPFSDVKKLTASVTDTTLEATLSVGRLWPTTSAASPGAYSVVINGHRYDSQIPAGESQVMTWDNGREVYIPGASSWDAATNTVKFQLSRRYLERFGITAPYWVGGQTNLQNGKRTVAVDDTAPEGMGRIGVTGNPLVPVENQNAAYNPPKGTSPYTLSFEAEQGNKFTASSTNFGLSLVADNHAYTMYTRSLSDVELTLDWDDPDSQLELTAKRPGQTAEYAEYAKPTKLTVKNVQGYLDLQVAPFMMGPKGATYTLTAKVTPLGADTDRDGITDPGDECPTVAGPAPSGCKDRDKDGVPNKSDQCKKVAGTQANGCPITATEWIKVYVGKKLKKTIPVYRMDGVGNFATKVKLSKGKHKVRTVWLNRSGVLAEVTRTVRKR